MSNGIALLGCRTSSASRLIYATVLAFALCTGSGCGDDACLSWARAAQSYAECYGLVYPPVESPSDIRCRSDDAFRKLTPDAGSTAASDSIEDCAAYLKELTPSCTVPGSARFPSAADDADRFQHCAFDVVESWTPPSIDDPCERWKHVANYLSDCDPVVVGIASESADCVDDTEVEAMTDGRFSSVAECAAYLYDHACPCEVPLGDDRELCLNLGVSQ